MRLIPFPSIQAARLTRQPGPPQRVRPACQTGRIASRAAAVAALALLLAGCAGQTAGDPASPHYQYPTGLRLILRQAIEIPPDAASARLQFGRQVPRNGVDDLEPHCILEVEQVRPTAQRLEPDDITVTTVRRRISTLSAQGPERGLARRVLFSDDHRPSHVYYITEFQLRSAKQPDIRMLACQSNQMAPGIPIMRHLTLEEIRQALGDLASLRFTGAAI